MSIKHIHTIADLVWFRAGLKIECGDCGADRTLDGYQPARLGAGTSSIAAAGQGQMRTLWQESSDAFDPAAGLMSALGGKQTLRGPLSLLSL